MVFLRGRPPRPRSRLPLTVSSGRKRGFLGGAPPRPPQRDVGCIVFEHGQRRVRFLGRSSRDSLASAIRPGSGIRPEWLVLRDARAPPPVGQGITQEGLRRLGGAD